MCDKIHIKYFVHLNISGVLPSPAHGILKFLGNKLRPFFGRTWTSTDSLSQQ